MIEKAVAMPRFDPFADMRRLLASERVGVAFDVGGCYGVVAKKFEEIFPEARIFSFEPRPDSFETLKRNVLNSPRITPVNLGAYHTPSRMQLYLNAVPGSSSLLRRPESASAYHNPKATHTGTAEVELVRLDEWAAAAGIECVDLLKLDIQGSELNALRGCTGFLRNTKAVYTEVQFFPVYQGACLLDELWSFLRTQGFGLFQLYSVWGGRDGQLVQGDALFISDTLRSRVFARGPVASQLYFNGPEW